MRATLLLICLVPACLPTKSELVTCATDTDCNAHGPGLRCDLSRNVCVCASAAYPGCEKFIDAGMSADGPNDVPVPPADVIVSPDSPPDIAIVDAPVDSVVLDSAVADVSADTRAPDSAGTCGVPSDCPNPAKGFCVGGVCTACSASLCAGKVDGGTAVCATTGTAAGQCVECVAPSQCTNPAKSFCVNNACTGCTANLCSGGVDGGTAAVCATSGSAAGQCVECVADGQCTKDPAKGFCAGNTCMGCTAALCSVRTDGKTTCATTGTSAGQCVECSGDAQCTKDPAKAFCVSNACTGCSTSGATGCAGRTDGKTTCATIGTAAGQCVVCVASSDCKVATSPICNTANQCVPCQADSECVAKLGTTGYPGVCMIDGHCAADSETVYVQNVTGCSSNTITGGTAAAPFCTAHIGVNVASTTSGKTLVLLTGLLADFSVSASSKVLTIVGKGGVVTPAPATDGVDISSGEVYLRNLTIKGVTTAGLQTAIGINAYPAPGSTVTLHMDTCAVTNNPGGGILLNGAAFDIKNITVSNNGSGTTSGGTRWGGVRIDSLPTAGSTTLSFVSIQSNGQVGLSCAASITTSNSVLATGNNNSTNPDDQISGCGITPCTPASTTCGEQSAPQ